MIMSPPSVVCACTTSSHAIRIDRARAASLVRAIILSRASAPGTSWISRTRRVLGARGKGGDERSGLFPRSALRQESLHDLRIEPHPIRQLSLRNPLLGRVRQMDVTRPDQKRLAPASAENRNIG